MSSCCGGSVETPGTPVTQTGSTNIYYIDSAGNTQTVCPECQQGLQTDIDSTTMLLGLGFIALLTYVVMKKK